jgi:toxin-antitoxin system PIN domain toxin
VIAIDTNILVYAHRRDSPLHVPAAKAVAAAAEGSARWALPWPCVHEFFGLVTHPRIYDPPSSIQAAISQLDAWLESPTVELIGEEGSYWSVLRGSLLAGQVQGPRVHDARVAALCRIHGVRELWSLDRDFGRFPELNVKNPLRG